MQRRERKPYWRHTKWQMMASLVPFLLVMVAFPFYAGAFVRGRFIGYPLGFFLACHGVLSLAFLTIAAHVNRQDAIDRWHGAHEDL